MPSISGRKQGDGVQAVVLALNMLEHLAQSQRALGVTELARALGTTKSRIHRHLQTLVAAGYLTYEAETERYRVSARLMALGQTVSEGHELTVTARNTMLRLRDELGHSVALSVPEAEGMRIIAVLAGSSSIEIGVKPGSILPFHSSAQGKVALAFGDESRLRQTLNQPQDALTPHTRVAPLDIAADVRTVQERGWATAPSEALVGLNAVAAPIRDALGHFVGALGIVDSIQFIPESPSERQIEAICKAVRQISADLGFRPSAKRF